MKRISAARLILFGLAGAALVLLGSYAIAQVVTGSPAPIAAVCAYNAGGPPTPVNGSFYYIQCDGNGKIIVQ